MKIVISNHEFRAHFPARIKKLYDCCKLNNHNLKVIELFGKSICYEFSKNDHEEIEWEVMFPNQNGKIVGVKIIKEKLYEFYNNYNPDVIFSGIPSFPVGIISLQWAKENNKAIVQFGNARKNTFDRNVIIHYLKKMMFRNVDAFLCPSEAWDESMIFWGFKKQEIFYGLNVANNKFWENKADNNSFDFLPKEYFLVVGRHVKMKNLPRLLMCYLEYQNLGGKLPLVLVGDGILNDELKQIAHGNKNIFFLPFQSHENIRELFCKAKALLLPSFREETWGIIVNEAMSAGLIVAASSECGCSTTIVKNNETGFIFDPHEKKEIIKTLQEIESLSKLKADEMSQKAHQLISKWDIDRFSQGVISSAKFAIENKKKVRNPFDKALIKFWKGRMNITNK